MQPYREAGHDLVTSYLRDRDAVTGVAGQMLRAYRQAPMPFSAASRDRLYGPQALHAAVPAVKEQLGGSMVGGEGRDVVDRLAHHRMGVVLEAAVPARPPVLTQLDHAKEQSHRVSLVPDSALTQ